MTLSTQLEVRRIRRRDACKVASVTCLAMARELTREDKILRGHKIKSSWSAIIALTNVVASPSTHYAVDPSEAIIALEPRQRLYQILLPLCVFTAAGWVVYVGWKHGLHWAVITTILIGAIFGLGYRVPRIETIRAKQKLFKMHPDALWIGDFASASKEATYRLLAAIKKSDLTQNQTLITVPRTKKLAKQYTGRALRFQEVGQIGRAKMLVRDATEQPSNKTKEDPKPSWYKDLPWRVRALAYGSRFVRSELSIPKLPNTTPDGLEVAYQRVDASLSRQLDNVDQLDTKSGVLIGAVGAALAFLVANTTLQAGGRFWVISWLVLALVFACIEFVGQRYSAGLRPEVIQELSTLEEDQLKLLWMISAVEAYKRNQIIMQAKFRSLNIAIWCIVAALVGGVFLAPHTVSRAGKTKIATHVHKTPVKK